jgi:hypothetical protein
MSVYGPPANASVSPVSMTSPAYLNRDHLRPPQPASAWAPRALWFVGGAVALLAAAALLAAVELRAWRLAPRAITVLLFRWHDALLAIQSALLMPLALILSRIATSESRRSAALAGVVVILSLIAVCVLEALRSVNIGPDTLYMLPQGVFGAWIIVVSRHFASRSPAVWRLGLITGIGLVMIAGGLLTVLLYFGPAIFTGPIADPGPYAELVNRLAHYNLRIASYVGRLGFPIWVLLVGRLVPSNVEPARPA